MKILMVAAENDAIAGGKVGGIADVVRDIPFALAKAGHHVDVVTPGYGTFSRQTGAQHVTALKVMFSGSEQTVDLFTVPGKVQGDGVTLWVLEHPLFAAGGEGKIYCDDPSDRPFATDASKFALFSIAVAQAIVEEAFADGTSASVDILHLHDWHAAMVSVLRAFDPAYSALQSIHTVFTIHNLALQGIRPLADNESSLRAWFPDLQYDVHQLNDPRVTHCINPMRAGINLSDKVHAVSPTYAQEIQRASNAEQGFSGGEGLQEDLQRAAKENRLHGILNGCDYAGQPAPALSLNDLLLQCEDVILKWVGEKPTVESAHLIASRRLARLMKTMYADRAKTPDAPFIVTSVGRITDQKVLLLRQRMSDGDSTLDHLLRALGAEGVLVLLGSGNPELEQFLTQAAAQHENFVFMKGYDEALPQSLYGSGDLFLMPSSYEPCGISQMLAMREGQLCLVHSVGGLRDTVRDGVDGFSFTGDSLAEQAKNLLLTFDRALTTRKKQPKVWNKMGRAAADARFLWDDVADEIVAKLYRE
jgi:starch synthase